jgi:hypothetical protein
VKYSLPALDREHAKPARDGRSLLDGFRHFSVSLLELLVNAFEFAFWIRVIG